MEPDRVQAKSENWWTYNSPRPVRQRRLTRFIGWKLLQIRESDKNQGGPISPPCAPECPGYTIATRLQPLRNHMDRIDSSSAASGNGLPPGIDRRGFLRTVAGGTAAVAFVSLIPAGCSTDYPVPPAVELGALSPKEFTVVRAAAESLLADVPVSPEEIALRIDRELALVGEPVRGDFKTAVTLLEHLTPLGGKFRRFTALSPEARLSYLHGWRGSRFVLRRAVFQAVKAFVFFFAYCDDATRTLTGFPGPWQERTTIPAYPVDFGEIV